MSWTCFCEIHPDTLSSSMFQELPPQVHLYFIIILPPSISHLFHPLEHRKGRDGEKSIVHLMDLSLRPEKICGYMCALLCRASKFNPRPLIHTCLCEHRKGQRSHDLCLLLPAGLNHTSCHLLI